MMHSQIRAGGGRLGQLSGWLRRGLDLLFPPRCVACSQVGSWFCVACQTSVERVSPPICSHCGQPLPPSVTGPLCSRCRTTSLPLDGIRSVAIHDGALRHAIHHLKYRHRRELADTLGRLLAAYWQEANLPADLVIPVPLHAGRMEERGYNQAALLARGLVAHIPLAVNETDFIRTRETSPQVGLGASERVSNVRDAFAWVGDELDGASVLLIDDVCTTGSTLGACALPLRQAGVGSVWALTLARAR